MPIASGKMQDVSLFMVRFLSTADLEFIDQGPDPVFEAVFLLFCMDWEPTITSWL